MSLAVPVGAAALLGSAQVAHATDLAFFQTQFGTDWVSAGAGGLRNVGSSNSLALAGVSGPVKQAFLYWSGPTNSRDPTANANVVLAGTPITGTNIGFSNDNCWGYNNSQAYRADVTAIVQANLNGPYTLSGFGNGSGGINSNGASLIVFFNDVDHTNNRDVVIFDGNDSNITNAHDADGWNISLPGINYTTGTANMELHVADGQVWLDDALILNALTLDAGPQIFPGTTVPSDNAGPTGNGSLWDIVGYDVTSWLSPGPNTLTLTTGVNNDCLSAHVVAFDLPAGAAPDQPPFRKQLTSGPDADGDGAIDVVIEVGQLTTTQYDFTITYSNPGGPPVLIVDTAPAEWIVTEVGGYSVDVDECGESVTVNNDFGSAEVFKNGTLGKKCRSSTKILWTPDPDGGELNVVMETRQSPGKKNLKFAPTSCGPLYLNSGPAMVFEVDPATGEPLRDPATGELLPPLFTVEPLVLAAVPGDGVALDGSDNQDGDALTDIQDVQHGFSPCSVGTGTLYAGTDEEEFASLLVDRLAVTPVVGGVPGATTIVTPTDDFVNGLAPTGTGTLFSGDPLSSDHHEIDVAGTTISTVTGPLDADCCNEDLAFDGTHVWRADFGEGPLFKYLPDGTLVAQFDQTDVVGATYVWPADQLWISKWGAQQVGTFDPGTNTFTPVIATPDLAGGLAYDIERGILWVGLRGGTVQAYDLTAGAALIAGSAHMPFGFVGDTVDGLAFIPD